MVRLVACLGGIVSASDIVCDGLGYDACEPTCGCMWSSGLWPVKAECTGPQDGSGFYSEQRDQCVVDSSLEKGHADMANCVDSRWAPRAKYCRLGTDQASCEAGVDNCCKWCEGGHVCKEASETCPVESGAEAFKLASSDGCSAHTEGSNCQLDCGCTWRKPTLYGAFVCQAANKHTLDVYDPSVWDQIFEDKSEILEACNDLDHENCQSNANKACVWRNRKCIFQLPDNGGCRFSLVKDTCDLQPCCSWCSTLSACQEKVQKCPGSGDDDDQNSGDAVLRVGAPAFGFIALISMA